MYSGIATSMMGAPHSLRSAPIEMHADRNARICLTEVEKKMDARLTTRTRITAIPTLLATGAFASLAGPLAAFARQATPVGVVAAPDAWTGLGLPELNLTVGAEGVTGLPESIEAGRYLLTVHGEPPSESAPGGVMFLQLPEGMTLDDAMAADSSEGPPDFFYDALVPGGAMITEAGSSVSIIDLPPGEWVVADSRLTTMPVIVPATGEMPADLPEPESNATFALGEMFIELSEGSLHAGENLIRIVNDGDQPHFVDFNRLPDGTTNEQIAATIEGEMSGTPGADAIDVNDVVFVTSSGDQSSGTTMWMQLTLEAGTYAGICWFPDRETGMPHAAMGMHMVFEVE